MVYIPYPRTDLDDHELLTAWRAKAIKTIGEWTFLKVFLADSARIFTGKHSLTKCWYSEMFQGDNYALDVEHFRPKNQAGPLTEKQIKEIEKLAGIRYQQSLTTGSYNWLEFDYRNYRIVSAVTNRGGGKHIYFPVAKNTHRLNNGNFPWIDDEFPYFLDPTNKHDASLLFVKPNGEIASITAKTQLDDADFDALPVGWNSDGFNYLRAVVTIKLYRLNDAVFIKARKELYDDVTRRLDTLSLLLAENPGSDIKRRLIEDLFYLLLPSSQFSLTAQSAVKAYLPSQDLDQEIQALLTSICKDLITKIQEKINDITIDWTKP